MFDSPAEVHHDALKQMRFVELDGVSFQLTKIASGGCATAYLGQPGQQPSRLTFPRLLFKVPHPHVLARDCGLRQWQQECEILSALQHPAIPRPVAIRSAPQPFMAYPYIPGHSLKRFAERRLDAGSSTLEETIAVGISLLRVLGYLHKRLKPIAHGDVRMENVLLDRHRYVRLIDFGCAHMPGNGTYSGWVAAPRYLSPEQARGEPWDCRSDLYQVGLIMYELLVRRPFNRAQGSRAAMLKASTPDAFPIDEVRRAAGKGVAHWLADMLEPDRRARVPSADCAARLLLTLTGRRTPSQADRNCNSGIGS